jgi:MoxR-like ATPase
VHTRLLPNDITGVSVFNQKIGEFEFKQGPIFVNILLADEINRAPAKVQSALLECMQEKQVTLGKETFHLQEPFMVIATQNPIEHEGTYPLPEAQMDRFLMHIYINYPNEASEIEVIRLVRGGRRSEGSSKERARKSYHCSETHLRRAVSDLRNPCFGGYRKIHHGLDHGHTPA